MGETNIFEEALQRRLKRGMTWKSMEPPLSLTPLFSPPHATLYTWRDVEDGFQERVCAQTSTIQHYLCKICRYKPLLQATGSLLLVDSLEAVNNSLIGSLMYQLQFSYCIDQRVWNEG